MRKLLMAASAVVMLAAAYVAAPFHSAWAIREAMRTGDSAYLAHKLEWPTVRETLRASMLEFAVGPPPPADATAATPPPGLWQRVKTGLSRRAVDGMIDTYVNPERLPQLFTARQFYRENISGEAAADAALAWHQRARRFWSRIVRAEFHSPTVFEIEMQDRNDPTRRYVGLLRLRGLTWKLTELRVLKAPDTNTRQLVQS